MAKFEFLARTNDTTTRNFDLEKTIILFLDDKKLQKRSEKTIKTYKNALAHYTKYCNEHELNGNEIDCVRQYIHYMTFEKVKWDDHPTNISTTVGVSPRSINNAIRFIRVFYNWAVSKKYINHNPAQDVGLQKENQESFEIFTDDEIESLLNSPRRRSYTGMRDYTMMVLMIDTGLRVGELTNLVRGDFDLTYRQINIRAEISKSKRSRSVPISRTTANLLQDLFDYTNIVEDETEEFVFLTQYGERYYGDTFAKMLKQYAKRAGMLINARVSPHTFRHYFAIKFLRNGGDPFALMKILGHTDYSMTNKYVRYASVHLQEVHDRVSPAESVIKSNQKTKGKVKFK